MVTQKISTKLRLNDEVVVISGTSKRKKGKILAIHREKAYVWIKGVNLRKKILRPSQENPKGGSIEIEAPIHISNVQYWDSKSKKGTRLSIVHKKENSEAHTKDRFMVCSKQVIS